MRRHQKHTTRIGFTIVELLVAMALIIFIMYVLAEAFSAGATAFRNLKAIGDMDERLRSAISVIRRYLQADHFDPHKRLSDPGFWNDGPPANGFFRIWQNTQVGSTTYVNEGSDLDSNPSFRVTDHGLHFTVRLRGNDRGDYFRAAVPNEDINGNGVLDAGEDTNGNTVLDRSPLLSLPNPGSRFQDPSPGSTVYTSSWAEVAIYMKPSGDDTSLENANATGTALPLYTLYLRQRLLVPSNEEVFAQGNVAASNNANYLEVSQLDPDPTDATKMYFNNPADLTMPVRRFGASGDVSGATAPSNYPTFQNENVSLRGNDVLLTDVLSFDVRVLLSADAYGAGAADFVDLYNSAASQYAMGNPSFYHPTKTPTKPAVFDTWSSRKDNQYDYSGWSAADTATTIPMYQNSSGGKIRIRAIQITIRIWDSKTKQTRQSSLVVDM